MPEIVEVEKLRLWFGKLVGTTIDRFESAEEPAQRYCEGFNPFTIRGATITNTDRHGKRLAIEIFTPTEQTAYLGIRLSFTGWFLPNSTLAATNPPNPIWRHFIHHINPKQPRFRMILSGPERFDKPPAICYYDSRSWGRITLHRGIAEALGNPSGVPDWLDWQKPAISNIVQAKTTRTIKDLLEDQNVNAGLGNYLILEALFAAGIHPFTPTPNLGYEQRISLCKSIIETIQDAMNCDDHSHWEVYQREGLPCVICKTPIVRVKDGPNSQRSSYFCPTCQPEPSHMREPTRASEPSAPTEPNRASESTVSTESISRSEPQTTTEPTIERAN